MEGGKRCENIEITLNRFEGKGLHCGRCYQRKSAKRRILREKKRCEEQSKLC